MATISSLGSGSGLDLSGLLKSLMQAEQRPLTALQTQGNRMNAIVVDCKKYRLRSIAYRGAVHSL